MTGAPSGFPEVVFLRRPDDTGYGFFFYGEADFRHAADSFTRPILRSFRGEPVPGQPDPKDHLATAALTFVGQAFDGGVSADVGAEGISRAVAAMIRARFATPPRIVVIERDEAGHVVVRPGAEFLRHPGHPLAVVVDADTHGGDARFFKAPTDFAAIGESEATARCWLPQIVYRLYARTPSVMAGKPLLDRASGRHSVEFRGLDFGRGFPPVERAAKPA